MGYLEYRLSKSNFANSYATKKYWVEQQLESVETLILGSSESFNGIDPSFFTTKTYNLANVSQTLYYDKEITLKYLPKMPHLKNVVINISYFSFFYQLEDIKEKWRCNFYQKYFGIASSNKKTNNLNNNTFLGVYELKHSLELAFNKFVDSNATTILKNGYQPKFTQEIINDSSGLARIQVHNSENFKGRRKEIENELENFVQVLQQKNIKIIFVSTPVFSTYSKFCDKNIIEQNKKYINYLCTKYQCSYLNYFTDTGFTKDDFFDNDHLKDNGAKKLSTKINEAIKNY